VALELRRIGPDDWRLWREVRLRALGEAPAAFSSSLAEWRGKGDTEARWRARLDAVPYNVVALDGDRLVGQVSGTGKDAQEQVELISLWAAPEVRGQGVGSALIEAVADWAAAQNATAVVLKVKRSNQWAIAAYGRAGFQAAGPAEDAEEALMVRLLR
jgi:RimJ/RimL family protein N-acetyltransferase